ncbi:hypothetical protein [Amycolatopsis saalfeldensis]|uniref:NmrA-like family protein n=1 Tax=Amycolatopsis saalfeldensis TaxID=394193 RepID=A0A1H8QJ67_9PSEU|nr:hypothetical protein [Amycolatopsis saalfeldensis]SEO53957.1 hypothetical protein SAMN04489732_101370 [Amycolatopsis saalfeldensis]
MRDVLVLGSTGNTGGRVLRQLRDRGVPARAATRRPTQPGQVWFGWAGRSTQQPGWAVLRPSWFMQTFTGDHLVARTVRDGEIVTATGDARVGFVDATDFAAVAVRALTDAEPHNTEHAARHAAMDDAIREGSEDRVTDTVERVTGRPARDFRTFANEEIR